MKKINFWVVAVMALSCSMAFISCSDEDEKSSIPPQVAGSYQYDSELSISVMGNSYGSTNDCKAVITQVSETTVDITLNGFGNLTGGAGNMNLADFTISGVNVETAENGGYSLSIGAFESMSGETPITGESLNGTVTADGKANITTAFKPGAMPMAITVTFKGSKTESKE